MRSERELYALWERTAQPGSSFRCTTGERITVLSPGRRNTGPGPDYPGAVLLVDGRIRSGAVEMHRREEEWFAHGHQHDRAYQNVILHLLEIAPERPRLLLPTVDLESLSASAGIDVARSRGPEQAEVTPELLLELSWGRFLRRTTALLRQSDTIDGQGARRAFVRMLFDALGYSGNRTGMRRVVSGILEEEDLLRTGSFEQIAAMVFRIARVDRSEVAEVGRAFVPDSRLLDILPDRSGKISSDWRAGTRPANAPARRLWGGAKLLYDLYRENLFERLEWSISSGRSFDDVASLLVVRLGAEVVIGRNRAAEITLNALLPVTLALGLREGRIPLIEGSCRLYRNAPAQGTNRHLQLFRQRYNVDLSRRGAFWQQGGIELIQRYLTEDRSNLSFVAENISYGPARGTSPPLDRGTVPLPRCSRSSAPSLVLKRWLG